MTQAYAAPQAELVSRVQRHLVPQSSESKFTWAPMTKGAFFIGGAGPEAATLLRTWQVVVAPLLERPGVREWNRFFGGLQNLGLPTAQVESFKKLWNDLTARLIDAPFPAVEEGDEGSIVAKWSSHDYYAEVEVGRDGSFEWFVRDRASDRHDGSSESRSALDQKFFEKFAAVNPR